ncbi:BTB/POZ domain-containing protein At2g24240-like [Solanum pennellii]|uniref:BTB/POZ domain-containing protein At2g24240-like n=1 Tax=Solanum pennellii TaxID=28526 RepID=A0ABM1FQ71_SOLPN|nr:BTB/POZ domain-containing protein At2g24240-like [Solanum pennellii]
MESQKDRVKLDVGGKKFETTATTLASGGRTSFFGAMFNDDWNLHSDGSITELFIDRNPEYFGVLLDLLRTGELYIPRKIDKKHLYREALYYGIEDHLRLAKWGPFDGNRLRLAESIKGPTKAKAEKIRASPNSWCCVVRDNIVSVYNWMLEEQPTITTCDYRRVNDVCWVNSDNITVSSSDKYLASEGIGLFSASTGELKYNFQVKDEDQLKDYTAGALGVGSDYKLFSSCTEITNKKNGIAVWDQITGKQTDFLQYLPYSKATKLQWLQGTNCLMAATCHSESKCSINLFDFRQNTVALSWSDATDQRMYKDAIAIEERNSICIVDSHENLGFMDLRSTTSSIEWRSTTRDNIYNPYPKLAFHEGQLLASLEHTILVYCGPDWVPTSQLQPSHGGLIWDLSIGGDRLFALYWNIDMFDVWETPRP